MCLPVLSWAHLSKSTGKRWMTRFIWNSAWPQKQRSDCLPCLYPSSNINTAYCVWLHCYKFWTTLSSSIIQQIFRSASQYLKDLGIWVCDNISLWLRARAGSNTTPPSWSQSTKDSGPSGCDPSSAHLLRRHVSWVRHSRTLESTRAHTLLFAKSAAICWHHHCLMYFPFFYWSTWQFCGGLHSSCCCRQGPSHSLWLRNCSLRKQCVFARVPPETHIFTYYIHIKYIHILYIYVFVYMYTIHMCIYI